MVNWLLMWRESPETIQAFLEKNPDFDANTTTAQGRAIEYFVQTKDIEKLKILFKYGKNVDVNVIGDGAYGVPVLHTACDKSTLEIMTLLLQREDIDVNLTGRRNSETAFDKIVKQQDEEVMRIFLQNCKGKELNTNNTDISGDTALYRFCEYGKENLLKCLLENGENIDVNWLKKNRPSNSPVHRAASHNNPNILKLLLQLGKGVDCNLHNERDETLVMKLARLGKLEKLEILMKYGTNIDLNLKYKGETVLHQLCNGRKGDAEALKIILENCENHILDVNLETDSKDKHTAFTLACKREVPELIQCLLEYGKDVDCNYYDPWKKITCLWVLCDQGETECVEAIVKYGKNVKMNELKYGHPAIYYACFKGHEEIVKLLLQYNHDLDLNMCFEKNRFDQETILMHMCEKKNAKIVELLLTGKDIDPNLLVSEELAVNIACRGGAEEVIQVMLECEKVDFTKRDQKQQSGRSPLHVACEKEHLGIVKMMIESGRDLDINSKSTVGKSAFYVACQTGNIELVTYLLNCGKIDITERGLFHNICESRNIELVKLFAEMPEINVNEPNNYEGPILNTLAFRENNGEVIQYLLSLPQLDVNMLAPDEGTGALHKACEKGHIDYVKMMLERKEIDVDLQNKPGGWTDSYLDTPLHKACEHGHEEIVKLLLAREDTNVLIRNKTEKTPADIAKEKNFPNIVELLEDPMKIQQERKLKEEEERRKREEEEERIRLEEEERRNFGKLKFRKLDYWKTKNVTAH